MDGSIPVSRSADLAAFLKIDLNNGTLSMETRNEQLEFPRVDPRFVAQRNRQVFYPTYIGAVDKRWGFNAVMRLDVSHARFDQLFANRSRRAKRDGKGMSRGCAYTDISKCAIAKC